MNIKKIKYPVVNITVMKKKKKWWYAQCSYSGTTTEADDDAQPRVLCFLLFIEGKINKTIYQIPIFVVKV